MLLLCNVGTFLRTYRVVENKISLFEAVFVSYTCVQWYAVNFCYHFTKVLSGDFGK